MTKLKSILTLFALSSVFIFLSGTVSAQTVSGGSIDIWGIAKVINNSGNVLVVEQLPDPANTMNSIFHVGIWNYSTGAYDEKMYNFIQDPIGTSTNAMNDSNIMFGTDFDPVTGVHKAFWADMTTSGSLTPQYIDQAIQNAVGSPVNESYAFSINNNGQMAGYYVSSDLKHHLFVYENGVVSLVDDSSLQPFTYIEPLDINNNGIIAVYTDVQAYTYNLSTKSFTVIADPNHLNIRPMSLNDSGTVVGNSSNNTNYYSEAFIWSPTSVFTVISPIGLPPSTSMTNPGTSAYSINTGGQIVGQSTVSDGTFHAYLRETSGQMVDLGLVDASASASQALCINDTGIIVGSNVTSDTTLPSEYPVYWDYVITTSNNGKRIQKNKYKNHPLGAQSFSVSSKATKK